MELLAKVADRLIHYMKTYVEKCSWGVVQNGFRGSDDWNRELSHKGLIHLSAY